MKKIKSLITISFAIVMMFGLVACSKLTAENYAKIENNQTEEEVIKILGKPTKVESGSFLGVTGTTYLYKKKDKEVKISFVNGKVFAKEGSL
ncbi:MAG: hypothetical protein K1X66_08015 [Verrucomicrobiae bacterium]|nr:hypothetical protein [Verrucomicrobiae bacterium]